MMINGVDLDKLAWPATIEMMDTETETIFMLRFGDLGYKHVLSHFELINMNSNEQIVNYIINIINDAKLCLGINDTNNEPILPFESP